VDADATKSVIAIPAAPRDELDYHPHCYHGVLDYANLLRAADKAFPPDGRFVFLPPVSERWFVA
jgi:hypothetical protein